MKKLGWTLITIGGIWAFLLVSTDDYYTMELHTAHPIDWKGFLISGIIVAVGALLWWISDNFYIEIGRKK